MTAKTGRRTTILGAVIAVPFALVATVATFSVLSPAAVDPTPSPGPERSGVRVGATSVVSMGAPRLSPDQSRACLAFISQLPAQLRDLPARQVSDGPEQNAAFGDPPLTIQCGTKEAQPEPTAKIWIISGVCWYAQSRDTATVWETLDRKVPVAVTIPPAYAPAGEASGQWVAALSAPLVSAMPSKKTRYDCGPE